MVSHRPSLRPAAPLVALLASAAALARPTPAAACGGMVFPNHEARVGGMSDQELAVVFADTETVLVASAGYEGIDAAEFAFVLPLASEPAMVLDADPALFLALDEFSAPRVSVYVDDEQPSLCGSADKAGGANDLGGGEGGGDVMIHQRGVTATYEYVVIGGDTGTAIADWLTGAGYPLPADYAAALNPYVQGGWFFFAAKVKPGAEAGALAPIELHLPPAQPEAFRIPLGIAAHSLKPDAPLGVTTYFLAGGPVLTANYPSEVVDGDELVALSETETNYAELERAILDKDPGGAWIIDYSNPMSMAELQDAYSAGLDAGRIDPKTSDSAFVTDFAARLGIDVIHLTRLRTKLKQDQVRDLDLRSALGPPANNYYSATYDAREGAGACVIDRSGRLPQLLLLLPVLAWIRRRPRR